MYAYKDISQTNIKTAYLTNFIEWNQMIPSFVIFIVKFDKM